MLSINNICIYLFYLLPSLYNMLWMQVYLLLHNRFTAVIVIHILVFHCCLVPIISIFWTLHSMTFFVFHKRN